VVATASNSAATSNDICVMTDFIVFALFVIEKLAPFPPVALLIHD
jgi:hypothetical protein